MSHDLLKIHILEPLFFWYWSWGWTQRFCYWNIFL